MKESKVLKMLCYLLMPIIIALLVLSIFSIILKEDGYYNEEKYFASNSFASSYLNALSNTIYDLIHNNDDYYSLLDGDIEIHYSTNSLTYYVSAKDAYFLIIYKDKALTNVEYTEKTDTIEEIKTYIEKNEESKKINIIYGNIETESEIMREEGYKYLDKFTEPYYTIHEATEETSQYIEYITAYPEDFEIYSSYVEEFKENTQAFAINKVLHKLEPFETYSYFIIPVSAVFIILILVYLIISIGYKKGVKGIYLNDFDKVPLEIILVIAVAIGCIPIVLMCEINENFNALYSLIITTFLVIYILCAIVFDTTIKRIKAKILLKSTIIGKIIIWIAKGLEKILNKFNDIREAFTYSTNATAKLIAYTLIIVSISIFIFLAFHDSLGWILFWHLILISIIEFKLLKAIKNYMQIESKLKQMYEGNNKNKLEKTNFMSMFQNAVKYINDISNGFESAIQDRIKSERLKAELITNVSHDIKTPLTSIINYVDLLKQENIENDKAKEYIGILDNKSQRLKKLTEDLVEASKVSTGNISLNLEIINIVELIKQAVGEFEDKFQKRGLKAIIDSAENEINIMADSRYMYRIIENLFSNVSKYALENSRVYIDIMHQKEPTPMVVIAVKNISKDRLNISADELMQRFVRGDKSRTTEGSGLGISIAQNLTELQNGQFNLKLDGDLFKVELMFAVKNK